MKLKLLDTGYISATTALGSQTQLSSANRAGYTGSAVTSFTLDVISVSRSRAVNTENKTAIQTTEDSNTSFISAGNRGFKINIIWPKTITTSGYDKNDFVQLMRMENTRGLKILYPSEAGTSKPTIVEAEGAVNTGGTFSEASPTDQEGTVGTAIPYFVGRVKNITVNDLPNTNYWRITFDFEVSG